MLQIDVFQKHFAFHILYENLARPYDSSTCQNDDKIVLYFLC